MGIICLFSSVVARECAGYPPKPMTATSASWKVMVTGDWATCLTPRLKKDMLSGKLHDLPAEEFLRRYKS